jgi:hypothetical protein
MVIRRWGSIDARLLAGVILRIASLTGVAAALGVAVALMSS